MIFQLMIFLLAVTASTLEHSDSGRKAPKPTPPIPMPLPPALTPREPLDSQPSPEWFTFEDGLKKGPWTRTEIRNRLGAGSLTGDSLVWNEGMRGWRPIRAIKRLWPVGDDELSIPDPQFYPDHVPEANDAKLATTPVVVKPWNRWLAKLIDVAAAGVLLGLVFGIVGAGDSELISNDILSGFFATAALCLVLEPVCFGLGVRTPGKGLLNISVSTTHSSKLDLRLTFRRSVAVWARGLGLGIPIVSLFTTVHQYSRLTNKGATSYDADLGFMVSHGDVGVGRKVAIVAIIILVLLFAIIGMS